MGYKMLKGAMATLEVGGQDGVALTTQHMQPEMEVLLGEMENQVTKVAQAMAVLRTCLHSTLKNFNSGQKYFTDKLHIIR